MSNWYKLWFLLLLFGCEESFKEVAVDSGQDFFPVRSSLFRIYEVVEISYSAQGPDTSRYQLREQVIDSITNAEETSYILERVFRLSDSDPWEPLDNWAIRINNQTAIVTEENISYIKLSFPVIVGNTWNGNAFNTESAQNYRYDQAEAGIYDDLINQKDKIQVQIAEVPQNLVNQDERYEVYARGIGLVEKNYTILEFCTTNCGSGQIDAGIKLEQVLIEYGEE